MILNFKDQTTEDIFNGENSKEARKIPLDLWRTAGRKLDMVNAAHDLKDLSVPPGNRLEALKGNLAGFHSIRVNEQFRIIFRWSEGNAKDVQVSDYH